MTDDLPPLINSSFKRIPLYSAVQIADPLQNTDQIPIAVGKPRFKSAWKQSNNCPPIAPTPSRAIKSLGVDETGCLYEMKSCPERKMRISSTYPPPSRTLAYWKRVANHARWAQTLACLTVKLFDLQMSSCCCQQLDRAKPTATTTMQPKTQIACLFEG